MLKAGTIIQPMVEAGCKFGRQFILAQLDPLRAPHMARIPGNRREADPDDIGVAPREQGNRPLGAAFC